MQKTQANAGNAGMKGQNSMFIQAMAMILVIIFIVLFIASFKGLVK